MTLLNTSQACIPDGMQAVASAQTRGKDLGFDCEAFVAGLARLGLDELRAEWRKRVGPTPPACKSKNVLRGLLAWSVQSRLYGDLSSEAKHQLREHAKVVARTGNIAVRQPFQLSPGTTLTREWQGKTIRVVVEEKGFTFDGKLYGDLSSVARAITGTRWSGPRFFGLKPIAAKP
jgi:hypothetical protein